jgi:hypothetical protein
MGNRTRDFPTSSIVPQPTALQSINYEAPYYVNVSNFLLHPSAHVRLFSVAISSKPISFRLLENSDKLTSV